jgi:hypothetical protein
MDIQPITAILLNWNRPFNLKYIILPKLARHPLIDEIIISHGREDSMFDYENRHCRIIHRNDSANNENYGLSRRFLAMIGSKNDQVLILDDDLVVLSKTITFLSQCYQREPTLIHGLFGRAVNTNYEYEFTWVYGIAPLILTRCMMINKSYADVFFENTKIVEGLLAKGQPNWNGEDIFMSLVVAKRRGKLSRAYRLPYINLLYSELNGISFNLGLFFTKRKIGVLPHKKYRKVFTKTCIERLELQPIMNDWINSNWYHIT